MDRLKLLSWASIILIFSFSPILPERKALAQPHLANCFPMGWFPSTYGLKDHSVFWYDGYYYLVSIYLTSGLDTETRFAYGRSTDLCAWETLSPVLTERIPGTWDENQVWSPFVLNEWGTYYMYYTGVTSEHTQSIMVATSTNPSNPASWQRQGMVFQPKHAGTLWQSTGWADCRDPMVFKLENIYYLYYSSMDAAGGMVGLATATSPLGPWTDWGAILTIPDVIPESPTVSTNDGMYYIFYNNDGASRLGEHYRMGPTPAGPWTAATGFGPAWAHEIWKGQDGAVYTSYLTSYSVTISPFTWNEFTGAPFIGTLYYQILPLLRSRGG